MATLADQLGITLRGVQGNVAKALRQFRPGGATQQGHGIPALRGKAIPKIPRLSVVGTKLSKVSLPPVGTSPTAGKMAAPHPRGIPTESTLGRGFRSIRRSK